VAAVVAEVVLLEEPHALTTIATTPTRAVVRPTDERIRLLRNRDM
jgi:hypothetical protein